MANRNGMGPENQGPRTGRGLGNCAPNDAQFNGVRPYGQGRGLGRGLGRGQGRGLGRYNAA